jgi:Domain of unknown function (DUF222)/HNH endonuclease
VCRGQADDVSQFGGIGAAVAAVRAGLEFLASADMAGLPCEVLAGAVRGLSEAESVHLAARSRLLSAFSAQDAQVADGHPTTKSWLRWQTRATSGAAGAAVGWMRRLAAHPRVAAALAGADLSPSWAERLCKWSDSLPEDARDTADEILLAAAGGGADLADLAGLAQEIYERTAPPDPDDAPPADDPVFRDRWLRLDVHFRGAGRIEGNLTPECTAAVTALLESLGGKAGPGDDRSQGQRYHDALEEAARMLLATGTLPDVAGQPAHILLHATLDQLLSLAAHAGNAGPPPGAGSAGDSSPPARTGSAEESSPPPGPGPSADGSPASGDLSADGGREPGQRPVLVPGGPLPDPLHQYPPPRDPVPRGLVPGGRVPDAFLAGRAAGDGEPGWLATAATAAAYACDAKISTIITGHLDPRTAPAAFRDFLARLQSPAFPAGDGFPAGTSPAGPRSQDSGSQDSGPQDSGSRSSGSRGSGPPGAGLPPATIARLEATLIRYAAAMLSGPAGLASVLRSGLPGPLGTAVSLPLDITSPTATVPPYLRKAVIARDRHCAFPGCRQRPARCHVHHLIPRSRGGPTALRNLVLLCGFHHLYLIHRVGWSLVLNADGTTTATSPDGRKVWHSNAPPGARAA